jgi:hypothetical protein
MIRSDRQQGDVTPTDVQPLPFSFTSAIFGELSTKKSNCSTG